MKIYTFDVKYIMFYIDSKNKKAIEEYIKNQI